MDRVLIVPPVLSSSSIPFSSALREEDQGKLYRNDATPTSLHVFSCRWRETPSVGRRGCRQPVPVQMSSVDRYCLLLICLARFQCLGVLGCHNLPLAVPLDPGIGEAVFAT